MNRQQPSRLLYVWMLSIYLSQMVFGLAAELIEQIFQHEARFYRLIKNLAGLLRGAVTAQIGNDSGEKPFLQADLLALL